ALRANRLEVDLLTPSELPTSPLALSAWDAFLLVDLPARALPPASQAALQRAVRDLGRGPLMGGGRASFGAGGWRGTPIEATLPVEMLVEADERRPDIALAFLIDRSSSMGEPISGASGAPSKLDLAKEAVLQAGALLRPADRLGLLAFDIAAQPAWPLQPAGDPSGFEAAVLGIQAQGGTSLTAGLGPARMALAEASSTRRHAILLTDGWTEAGGMEAARREAVRLAAAGITLSVVGVGEASAPELAELAALGGGRYLEARDPAELPRIFVEETQLALGSFTVEQRFQPLPGAPSAILAGLDAASLPVLEGYDASHARPAAQVALRSPLEDPLLAQWQYGLGRSVAWTSTLDPTWADAWLSWPDFSRFATQLVGWILPPPETGGLAIGVALDGRTARVTVTLTGEALAGGTAADEAPADQELAGQTSAGNEPAGQTVADQEPTGQASAGQAPATGPVERVGLRLLGPDGKPLDRDLARVAADRFEAAITLPEAGAWLLRASGRDAAGRLLAARTAGLVLPLAPEYAGPAEPPTDPRLFALAEATGGRQLDPNDAAAAFDPVPGARGAVELWPWLLTLAVLLLPFDVAARRLGLGAAIDERRSAWTRRARRPGTAPPGATGPRSERVRSRGSAPSEPAAEADDEALLEGLRAARDRARRG
ncbi:MAG: VWA domain-containing protein, partial [Chloroflexi bacterium]|nr:VWA domain-containing protein [Chloroflexota bacterium]